MNRTQISRRMAPFKYLMIGGIVFCFYILIKSPGSPGDKTPLIIALVFITIFSILGYLAYYASTVEFDDEYMYVTNKKFDKTIPLNKITAIELTSATINQSHFWKISYSDDTADESVRIIPIYEKFNLFTDRVKEKNADVVVGDSVFY